MKYLGWVLGSFILSVLNAHAPSAPNIFTRLPRPIRALQLLRAYAPTRLPRPIRALQFLRAFRAQHFFRALRAQYLVSSLVSKIRQKVKRKTEKFVPINSNVGLHFPKPYETFRATL